MKCAACGNDNQASAKFCVHCGVVLSAAAPSAQSPPTSATGAAPVFRPVPAATPPSATATGTRPATPSAPPSPPSATATGIRPAAPSAPIPPAAAPAPSATAAAGSTRKLGLIGTAVGLLIALCVGGYFGYRMLAGGSEEKKTAVAAEPLKSEAPPPTAPSEPAKEAAAPPAAGAPPGQETTQPSATAASPGAPAAVTAAGSPSAGSPSAALHGMPAVTGDTGQEPTAPRKATAPKTPAKAGTDLAAAGSESPSKAGATASTKAPAAKAAAVAAASAAPQPDHWQMYAEALAGCASEKFFARFMCEQKTRARFCDGYWNKVPQCPVDNPTDRNRGQ